MSKLYSRLFAVLLTIGCCSQMWAQLNIDATCDVTSVQCIADLDAITCPDAPTLYDGDEAIGTADCLLVSERDSAAVICSATTAVPNSGSNAGAIVLYNTAGTGVNSQYFVPSGTGLELRRYQSGQAILSGTVQGVTDPTEQWEVFVVYEGLISDDEHAANGGGLKYDASCAPINPADVDWDIYFMNGGMSYLRGLGSLDGSLLNLNHAPASHYFGFQVGEGANDRNCNFGAGGWFSWSGVVNGAPVAGAMGDVLVDLECQTQPYDPCGASVTCYCVGVNLENAEFEVFSCTTERHDDTPPVFNNAPDDVTIQCTDPIPAVAVFTATDNCEPGDEEVVDAVLTEDTVLNPLGLNGCYTIVRTWTATDACGNVAGHTQVITVEDNEAPVWNNFTPLVMESCLVMLTEDEAEDTSLLPITAGDNCDDELDYSIDATEISGGCPTTWLRRWTATDDCGNVSEVAEQYIQLYDETPPTITAPADITIHADADCGYDASPAVTGMPSYSDHCTEQSLLDANLTHTDVVTPGSCDGSVIITRTWTTKDFCLNVNSDTQVITVIDTIAPTGSATSVVLDCAAYDGNTEYGTVTTDDNCSAVSYSWTTITGRLDAEGEDPGCYYYTREYTFTDDCGNSSTSLQTVWLTDTTPPVLISAEENRDVTCDAYGNNLGGILITATDDCGNVNITFEDAPLSGGCVTPVGRFERTYTISDDCGNSINFTQFLILTDDDAPVLTISCPDDLILNSDEYCQHDRSPNNTGIPTHTVTDGCQASDSVYVWKTYVDGPDQVVCEGHLTFTRTWTVNALDHCFNMTTETCTQEISVIDAIAPAAPGIDCPADVTLYLDEDCSVNTMPSETGMAYAETLDNCDQDPEIYVEYTDSPYEYECEADSGNTFSLETTLGALESASTTLEDDMTAVGLHVELDWSSDGCTEWPSDLTMEITSPNGQCVTISGFTDEEPNPACADLSWPNSWNTTTPGHFVMDFLLNDDFSGAGTWSLEVTENWAGACGVDLDLDLTLIRQGEGSYTFTRTWSAYAVDCAGNTSGTNSCTQEITVLDEIAPTIDATSPAIVTVACHEYEEGAVYGVTASDNCDSNVQVEVLYNEDCDGDLTHGFANDQVSGSCAGTFLRTYLATDDCGNTTTFQQVVELVDDIAPTIILICPGDITISKDGDCFANDTRSGAGEATYDVTDNCSVDSVCVVVEDGPHTDICAHSYSFVRTWTVKAYDDCENEGVASCSQTVTVVDDSAPAAPAIDTPADFTVYRDGNCDSDAGPASYPGLLLDANDNCSDDADLTQTVTFSDDTVGSLSCSHTILRTWSATLTDECGNTSSETTHLQTIQVLDTINPSIALDALHQIACEDYDANGIYASASDNCDDSPSLTLVSSQEIGNAAGAEGCGSFLHHYRAEDCSGNYTYASQTVQLIDNTAPTFDTFPDDATVQCGGSTSTESLGVPTYSDNCVDHEELVLTYIDEVSTYKAEDCQTIERRWTVTDPCGNSTTQIQTYEIEDSTYPTITHEAEDVTVECDGTGNTIAYALWLASHGGAQATDDCTTSLIWDYEVPEDEAGIYPELSDGCGATGSVTVTFYATDACGNSTPTTATFTIVDSYAPALTSVDFPDDATVMQNATCNTSTGVNITGTPTASAGEDDCCESFVSITHEDSPVFCLCEQDDDYQVVPDLIEEDLWTYAEIVAEIDGTVSFDWLYETDDLDGAFWDVAFYIDGSIVGSISGPDGDIQSGSLSFGIEAGQAFGMGIVSSDGVLGGASVLISNFSGPSGNDFIGVYASSEWNTYDGYNGSNTFSHDGETLLIQGTNVDLDCEGSYAFYRHWTVVAYDECGNESEPATHSQTISVIDGIAPQFTETCDYENGQTIEVHCEDGFGGLDIPAACNVEAQDNCDGDVDLVCTVDTVGEYAPTDEVAIFGLASTPAAFLDNGQTCNSMDPHAMRLMGMPNSMEFYTLDNVGLVEVLTTGEIRITADLNSTQVDNAGWHLTALLDPNSACGISHTGGSLQSCSPADLGISTDDIDAWQYLILNCDESSLDGFGPFSSGQLSLSHQPANGHYAFQLGVGANQQNANFGLSGWFYYEGTFQGYNYMGSGDLFFDMDLCLPWSIVHSCTATDDCGNATTFSYTYAMTGHVDGEDADSDLSGQSGAGDHTPVVIGGAGDLTTGKTPIRVTNLQPNPTNDVSQLGFVVAQNMRIRVDLIAMDGMLVAELYDGIAQTGVNHTLNIDADGLSGGMYQIRLSSNDYLVVKKLLVSE